RQTSPHLPRGENLARIESLGGAVDVARRRRLHRALALAASRDRVIGTASGISLLARDSPCPNAGFHEPSGDVAAKRIGLLLASEICPETKRCSANKDSLRGQIALPS